MWKKGNIFRLVAWLFILSIGVLTIYRLRPPDAVSANAPLTEFSSGRAIQHLKFIAGNPHPKDSPALSAVREYIVKELNYLGLNPEIQAVEANVIAPGAQSTQNIVARLRGTQANGKAVILVAHYDSVNDSNGACDNGAAVATLLETARALKTRHSLLKDVIFLFTDAEEEGLWGAKAFVAEHPWLEDVELVLNFDARGCSGPVFMFETSENNGWLIREFSKASPYPFANSLTYEIYKSLRIYSTDFTVFKKNGISGLNFAFVDDPVRHHTPLDTLSALDERSIQHQGTYAIALTQHFSNLHSGDPKATDIIYFDVLGLAVITYPHSWVIPLAITAAVLFVSIVIFGRRRKQLKLSGAVLGFFALLLSIGFSLLIVKFIWEIERALHPNYTSFSNYKIYLLGFVAIALSVTSLIFLLVNKKAPANDLTIGALFLWLIITLIVSWYMPSASYLLVWPFLFSLLGAAFMLAQKDRTIDSPTLLSVLSVCATAGIVLIGSTIYIISLGLGLSAHMILIALAVLLFGLLIPHMIIAATPRRWLLPIVSILVSICLLVIGNVKPAKIAVYLSR